MPEPVGPNFVADGDFDQTSLSDWNNYVINTTRVSSDLDGGYAALLAPDPTAGVAQVITGLTPGTEYQLTGLISSPNGGATYIGVKDFDDSGGVSRERPFAAWTQVTMTFTPAPGYTTALVFCWRSVSDDGLCTDVSVRALS